MRWLGLLLILVLAGCLAGNGARVDYANVSRSVEEAALPYLSYHGDDGSGDLHKDASLHAAAMNIERVGYHNGVDNSGNPDRIAANTYYTELAVWQDYVFLARFSAGAAAGPEGFADQQGGFVIIDVSRPSDPRFVGEFNALGGADIEVSHDGALAFFGTQRNTIEEMVGNAQQTENPNSAVPRGIHVVDVRQKNEPSEILFHPFPFNGPHTLTYFQHGARELLIVQTYDFYGNTIPVAQPNPVTGTLGGAGVFPFTQRVSVFEVVRLPGDDLRVALEQVAHYQIAESGSDGRWFFPHDVTVQVHPFRGQTYMYVAYWDKGVRIVDITDLPSAQAPQNPLLSETGAFTQFDPSTLDAIHLAKPFDVPIAGKHITVAEPEIIQATDETGYITFIDTTNPEQPRKACRDSYWTLPGDLGVRALDFSPHNFDTFGGKVALAHNHAGLWVIDVHNEENLCAPKTVGFYMDVEPRTASPRYQPYFWGVFEKDGLLYASDESSGLYILRYTGP